MAAPLVLQTERMGKIPKTGPSGPVAQCVQTETGDALVSENWYAAVTASTLEARGGKAGGLDKLGGKGLVVKGVAQDSDWHQKEGVAMMGMARGMVGTEPTTRGVSGMGRTGFKDCIGRNQGIETAMRGAQEDATGGDMTPMGLKMGMALRMCCAGGQTEDKDRTNTVRRWEGGRGGAVI